jgi:hypothetical protein
VTLTGEGIRQGTSGGGGADRSLNTDEEMAVVASQVSLLGARLDEDHLPETNGRMAVCRRCGAQTDSPLGRQHVPHEKRLVRAQQWLDAQMRTRQIDRTRQPLTKEDWATINGG